MFQKYSNVLRTKGPEAAMQCILEFIICFVIYDPVVDVCATDFTTIYKKLFYNPFIPFVCFILYT
jgi:hypothetical protein